MLDFIATKEKAKRIAGKYGIKIVRDFELRQISFKDTTLKDGVFWAYDCNQDAALISVYGYLKIVEKKKIASSTQVIQGQKYPMCGNCFKVGRTAEGISLIPVSSYN